MDFFLQISVMLLMVEEFVELCYLDVDLINANYYLIMEPDPW